MAPPEHLPIVGQPIAPIGGVSVVHGRCNCGGEQTALICVGGMKAQCPACQEWWVCMSSTFDNVKGKVSAVFGKVRAEGS